MHPSIYRVILPFSADKTDKRRIRGRRSCDEPCRGYHTNVKVRSISLMFVLITVYPIRQREITGGSGEHPGTGLAQKRSG